MSLGIGRQTTTSREPRVFAFYQPYAQLGVHIGKANGCMGFQYRSSEPELPATASKTSLERVHQPLRLHLRMTELGVGLRTDSTFQSRSAPSATELARVLVLLHLQNEVQDLCRSCQLGNADTVNGRVWSVIVDFAVKRNQHPIFKINPAAGLEFLFHTSFSVTQFNMRLAFRGREDFRHNAPTTVDEIQSQSAIRHPIDFDDFSVRPREFVLLQSVAHSPIIWRGLPSVKRRAC